MVNHAINPLFAVTSMSAGAREYNIHLVKEIIYQQDPKAVAARWCEEKGSGWSVLGELGKGGTAPVFEVSSPDGERALKIYDVEFSTGQKGEVELERIKLQLTLQGHDCNSLVQVYEGGNFQGRLYLLMSRAPGRELEKCLREVPRNMVRHIVGEIAKAALFLKSRDLCHRDIKAANIFVSEDFSQVTLLDISVIRNIYDPVGVGTDQSGQLPVLATARYSPPEYLFRLLEPCTQLWHSLTIYQLGALLHDLLMQEPLFEMEFLKSKDNRYRFAWIVATTTPKIDAQDMDLDLGFLARKALDKNWERRSALRLEDFLADANTEKLHALSMLGLGEVAVEATLIVGPAVKKEHLRVSAGDLKERIRTFLRSKGVTAKHSVENGPHDFAKVLRFIWNPSVDSTTDSGVGELQFCLTLGLELQSGSYRFTSHASLTAVINGESIERHIDLPDIDDDSAAGNALAQQTEKALEELAVKISRSQIET